MVSRVPRNLRERVSEYVGGRSGDGNCDACSRNGPLRVEPGHEALQADVERWPQRGVDGVVEGGQVGEEGRDVGGPHRRVITDVVSRKGALERSAAVRAAGTPFEDHGRQTDAHWLKAGEALPAPSTEKNRSPVVGRPKR